METAATLNLVLMMLAGTATLGWSAMAGVLRISPRASWRLAAANALLAAAVLLLLRRGEVSSLLHWPLPDLLSLAAFALARDAVRLLFKQGSSRRFDASVLALLLFAYAGMEPGPASLNHYILVYSLGAAWFLGWLAWDVGVANASAFTRRAGIALAAPFALAALFMLSRPLLVQQGDPALLPVPTLWAFIELLLLLNISLVVCVLARLLQVMRARAEQDGLTGLMNRRAFEARLRHEQQRLLRGGAGYALVLIDLDHFKRINDELGHAAGDQALVQSAERLRAGLREVDTLARLGGEEFIALLPATPLPAALQVAERLRAALAARPLRLADRDWAQTASLGVAHSDDGDEPMQRADQALYRVKAGGRNGVAC
jgi:diguanylate cyclase (GGDEF)-like protein